MEKNFNTDVVRVGVLGRKRGDRNRRKGQVRVDKSEGTTTGVMTSKENRALPAECPIRTECRIPRDLKLLGYREIGFLENEVMLIVGKKGD